jgi:hypothetical protein
MKTITDQQYRDVTNCTTDFSIGDISLTQAQDFLNRKGYDIIIHRAEQKKLRVMSSIPGTGEVRQTGTIDAMVERVLAVKPGTELPTEFTDEVFDKMGLCSVLKREIHKNLLA